jgi:hypothetical protein
VKMSKKAYFTVPYSADIFQREQCEAFPSECKWVAYGMDFGYSNDPTALIKIVYVVVICTWMTYL